MSLSGMNCDCSGPGTTCLWDCREMAAHLKCVRLCARLCVALAHTHKHARTHARARTHRWQRNLAEALICRLDAGLSFLLAATLCYRSFSTTLELITFTWRGQLTDNITKTFLLLEGLSEGCVEFATTVSLQSDAHMHTHTHTQISTQRQRNMTTFCLLGNYSANAVTVWNAVCPKSSEVAVRHFYTHTHTRTHTHSQWDLNCSDSGAEWGSREKTGCWCWSFWKVHKKV